MSQRRIRRTCPHLGEDDAWAQTRHLRALPRHSRNRRSALCRHRWAPTDVPARMDRSAQFVTVARPMSGADICARRRDRGSPKAEQCRLLVLRRVSPREIVRGERRVRLRLYRQASVLQDQREVRGSSDRSILVLTSLAGAQKFPILEPTAVASHLPQLVHRGSWRVTTPAELQAIGLRERGQWPGHHNPAQSACCPWHRRLLSKKESNDRCRRPALLCRQLSGRSPPVNRTFLKTSAQRDRRHNCAGEAEQDPRR